MSFRLRTLLYLPALCLTTTLVITLAITACTLTITPPPPATPSAQSERSPNGVIFTAEQSEEQLPTIRMSSEGTWTPTDADVAKLEAALPEYLSHVENPMLDPERPIWERVPDYERQYLGMVENGEQVIYANFFCVTHDDSWQDELVFVLDGGDCFFQVKYNPETNEFYDLSVNGQG